MLKTRRRSRLRVFCIFRLDPEPARPGGGAGSAYLRGDQLEAPMDASGAMACRFSIGLPYQFKQYQSPA